MSAQPNMFLARCPSLLGLRQHGRVHLGVFVGLAVYRGLEIVRRGPDAVHGREMFKGVDGIALGRGAEELGYPREAVLLGLLAESEVFSVGLALPGERSL